MTQSQPHADPMSAPSGRAMSIEWPPWKEIGTRIWASLREDRLMLVAGGVTFFILLALFPALVAFVSLYGLVFDPATIIRHAEALTGLVPGAASEFLQSQLARLAARPAESLTFGFIISLLLSVWSANGGVKSMIQGLNVAYEQGEGRSFVRLNLVALGLTLGATVVAVLLVVALAVVPAILAVIDLGRFGDLIARCVRWPIMAAMVAVALGVLYRYGPDRPPPPWRWLTWGSGLATLVWLAASVAFSIYLESFATMDATYGALGTPIAFLLWVWISVIVVIIGAEVNAVIERRAGQNWE
jgi:membrane protein